MMRRLGGLAVLAYGSLAHAGPKVTPAPQPLTIPDPERAALDRAARAPQGEVRISPSPAGRFGAWLVVGPFRSVTWDKKQKPPGADALDQAPPGVDEEKLAPRLGAAFGPAPAPRARERTEPPRWVIASSGDGAIDVKAALKAAEGDVVAYAAGTLHVPRAGRYYMLLGTDDGVRLSVDGRVILTHDEARPERDDDDLVPLDLAAGDHAIVLKLHQREGAWSFRARVVDAELAPPLGAYLALPGTSDGDARDLATKMSWVSFDRGVRAGSYAPRLTVKFPEGAPRGVPLTAAVKLSGASGPILEVAAGEVPLDAAGVGELHVALPRIAADAVEDKDLAFETDVAGRVVKSPFHPRKATREAIAAAERALAQDTPWLAPSARDSVQYLAERLGGLASRGDGDLEAQAVEARELLDEARAIEARVDPFASKTGPVRRAYRSPADGELHEIALYVPPSYRPGQKRTWPLVLALHGLNGKPMAMLRWTFGGDEPKKDQEWEDRHVYDFAPLLGRGPAGALDAFVVAPTGHGNTMYRDLGEDDVVRVLEWATKELPIDPARVTITGPSMGGIGTAAIAFRYPVFAAAEPLCGYHSYFVRRDFVGRPIRPWEKVLGEERSNVFWAENGDRTPLYVVHGTQDLPESNSGVLIEKYEQLKYSVEHEHPALGHNVWTPTYADLKGLKWLLKFRRELHPAAVHFRTLRPRADTYAWVHVPELEKPDAWGDVRATVKSRARIEAKTSGVAEVRFDRDEKLVDPGKLTVAIDGASIDFDAGEELALHKDDGAWRKGRAQHDRPWKRGAMTGPFRDVFHSPLLFVYGADDKSQARANEEVARAFASVRWGVTVRYPMMSDAEFFARGEPLANDRALFLVGNARSNRVVRALEKDFPIKIDGDAVVLAGQRITGPELGAAFVRPNPRRPDRYVAVVEGVDALGTWRGLSLPDVIPDFVVYDTAVSPSRGQMLLSAGSVRAAGFFQMDWSLPPNFVDPLAQARRPAAKSEYDATPYLP